MKGIVVIFFTLVFKGQICIAQKNDTAFANQISVVLDSFKSKTVKYGVRLLKREEVNKKSYQKTETEVKKYVKGSYTLYSYTKVITSPREKNILEEVEQFFLQNGKLIDFYFNQLYISYNSTTKLYDTIGYSVALNYYVSGKLAYQISNGHGITENDDFNAEAFGPLRYRKLQSLLQKKKKKK
jgi:hypothetical protein